MSRANGFIFFIWFNTQTIPDWIRLALSCTWQRAKRKTNRFAKLIISERNNFNRIGNNHIERFANSVVVIWLPLTNQSKWGQTTVENNIGQAS